MSGWNLALVAWCSMAGIPIGRCLLWHFLVRRPRPAFIHAVVAVAMMLPVVVIDLLLAKVWIAAFYAVLIGLCSYIAWRNRPRKNRLAAKATGMVRNLGHRLVVVPAPATGGRS